MNNTKTPTQTQKHCWMPGIVTNHDLDGSMNLYTSISIHDYYGVDWQTQSIKKMLAMPELVCTRPNIH